MKLYPLSWEKSDCFLKSISLSIQSENVKLKDTIQQAFIYIDVMLLV